MPFLPTLRTTSSPARADAEHKQVVALSDYYNTLLHAGIDVTRRQKPWDVARAVVDGYCRSVWVYKAVSAIAGASARLPYRLRKGEEEIDDHPLYKVLNRRANPLETGAAFRKRLSAQVLLSPMGAFVELTKARNGDVTRVDLLPPDRTRPVPGTGADLVSHYEVTDPNGWQTRTIDPEQVRWVREPHPVDPYRGMTPLEAAGMSIELDHFARAFNVSFMRNDARPGGIVAVDGDMDEQDMDRIESRFGHGPYEAGKLSVIAGQLSYVDVAARPRDLQYQAMSRNARTEVLIAFGVPESQLGNSADRTFSNAGEEGYAFWTLTMRDHNSLIVAAFDEDSEDDLEGFLDTSDVEVLQRAEQARREEARTEYDAGLITIDEYREAVGHEVVDNPHTRALYISSGKTPLPTREEDWTTLGLSPPADTPGQQRPEGVPAPPPPEPSGGPPGSPPQGGQPPQGGGGGQESGDGGQPEGPAPEPPAPAGPPAPRNPEGRWWENPELTQSAAPRPAEVKRPRLRLVKAIEAGEPTGEPGQWVTSDPDEQARDRLEMAVAAALEALAARQAEVIAARVRSPAARKHTRHWTADKALPHDTRVGSKVLDAPQITAAEKWAAEAQATVEPLLTPAAEQAATRLLDDLGYAAAAEQAAQSAGEQAPDQGAAAVAAGAVAVAAVLAAVQSAVTAHTEALAGVIAAAEATGAGIAEIIDEIRDYARRWARPWAAALASQAATGTVEGARDAAARQITRLAELTPAGTPLVDIERQWFSRRDNRVRLEHAPRTGADGQRRPLGEPFLVGDALLRFPGDPLGPPHLVRNCRCFLRYRARSTGRWVRRPRGERARVSA